MRALFNQILLEVTAYDQSSNTCQSFRINVKGAGGGGELKAKYHKISCFATDVHLKQKVGEG